MFSTLRFPAKSPRERVSSRRKSGAADRIAFQGDSRRQSVSSMGPARESGCTRYRIVPIARTDAAAALVISLWCNKRELRHGIVMPRQEFQLRISTRARRMRIDVSARRGVVVVVPRGTPEQTVRRFVDEKRSWIDRARDRVDAEAVLYDPAESGELPDSLRLRALDVHYPVEFRPGERARVDCEGECVRVSGGADVEARRAALIAWLKRHAREHLPPWLQRLAAEHGFDYQRVAVRGQRTRWASCSGRGTISLNFKLLFLPPRLVNHVLLHELAHTRHLNHSAQFWNLLERLDPQAQRHHATLNRARCWLPQWVELD